MDTTPGLRIVGDEAAVRQAIAILMEYCDTWGCISVRLSSAGKKGRVVLAVFDTFAGVNALDTGSVFDRFYKADTARNENNSFGLGLSIAKAIMARHRGEFVCRKGGKEQIRFEAIFRR